MSTEPKFYLMDRLTKQFVCSITDRVNFTGKKDAYPFTQKEANDLKLKYIAIDWTTIPVISNEEIQGLNDLTENEAKEITKNLHSEVRYTGAHGLEVWEILDNFLSSDELRGFYKANAIKYILRTKGTDKEDAEKAIVYLEKLRDHIEEYGE